MSQSSIKQANEEYRASKLNNLYGKLYADTQMKQTKPTKREKKLNPKIYTTSDAVFLAKQYDRIRYIASNGKEYVWQLIEINRL